MTIKMSAIRSQSSGKYAFSYFAKMHGGNYTGGVWTELLNIGLDMDLARQLRIHSPSPSLSLQLNKPPSTI